MDTCIYARDKRTNNQYITDVLEGWERQKWAVKVVPYKIKLIDEELLTNWDYEPDGQIKLDKWYPLEIKVSKYKSFEIDFKKNQIDKLYKIGGLILYIMQDKYTLVFASYIYRVGVYVDDNKSKVNHEAYRIRSSDFKWKEIKREQA
jgi:hypothetical protein